MLLIDDFNDGPASIEATGTTPGQLLTPATCLGSVRRPTVKIDSNLYPANVASARVSGGALCYNNDAGTASSLDLTYGFDIHNHEKPLNLNLSGYSEFQLGFLSTGCQFNVNVKVYSGGTQAQGSCTVHANDIPSTGTVMFSKFGPAATPALFKWSNVDFIVFLLQGPSAAGRNIVLDYIKIL